MLHTVIKYISILFALICLLITRVFSAEATTAPAGNNPPAAITATVPADSNVPAVKEGNVWIDAAGNKYFTCPVMGESGLVSDAPDKSIVNGVLYYYCCGMCAPRMTQEPDRFLKTLVIPGNIQAVDGNGNQTFHDPVDGAIAPVAKTTLFVDYEGKRYYLSTDANKAKFAANPASFLVKKPID